MAHIKRETHQQSNIQRSDITKFVPALRTLQKIVLSCRSPSGQIKVIQNSCGGGLTLTSLCERLLKSLSVKKPVIQLLVTSTQGHLELFADGGLFVLSFASTLVLNSVDSGINSRLLAEIFESFLTLTTEICNSSDCSFIIDARVSDLNFMTSFIKSVLKPKLFCQLDDHLLSFISKLLLEVFLYSVSEKTDWSLQEYIYVLKIEGNDIEDSKSFPGVLIEAPELSRFKKCKLNTTKHVSSHGQCIKCVVVTASMSGDFDELGELKYDVENAVDKDEECLKQLTQFCEVLIVNKVGLLLCQKVVHPRLKLQLRGSGVVVVDRIGSGPIKYLTKLVGANAIQSIEMVIPMTSYGSLANLDHVIIQRRSYLHLTHPHTPVTSLILCHQEEQQLLELKLFVLDMEELYIPAHSANSHLFIRHGTDFPWPHRHSGMAHHVGPNKDDGYNNDCADSYVVLNKDDGYNDDCAVS
ncbi:MKKS-like protein [Mya arenaria]|uniref:MKKS-like protein n=1 Tax=Mya arenaria TaxID=6604 RepID=A0ABY7FB69_MYAAR|nr:MKKS-like protein [Mya arenaria]